VADPAAAVADTHAILFHAAGGRGLGPKAAAMFARCERQQAIIYVPAIVMWEVSLLARVSRVNLRRTVRGFFDDLFSNPSYQPFDMAAEQICIADELRFSRDPFDLLICAAARALDLPLLTRDGDIRGAGVVRVIW
jgi:PIN domain nuclease of toxin-antitoxin system